MRNLMRALLLMSAGGLAQAASLPDPTRPPDFAPTLAVEIPRQIVDWEVRGITISSAARSAILNGSVVVQGQTIGPAIVVEITPTAVVLDYGGERVSVEMARQTIKQPVEN